MSVELRLLLFVICICTLWYVIRKIRKAQIQIQDTTFWVGISFLLLVLSIFPQTAEYFASLIGFQSAANFVYLCSIFILLIKQFTSSIRISQLDNRINQISQHIALLENENKDI